MDEQSLCIDAGKVERYLRKKCTFDGSKTIDNRSGQTVKAIMPVHLYGHPADLRALRNLASQYSIKIIEDGAEALGAVFRDERIGEKSLLCGLSFNGNKIITTGAGGMVLTNSKTLSEKVRYYVIGANRTDTVFS